MLFSPEIFLALGSILFLNLILSGDNAVIIAMASKDLPAEQRRKAIVWGSLGAVVLRVILTFVAAYLLDIPFLQAVGAVALLWIAVNLLAKDDEPETCEKATTLMSAIKVILVADLIMSLDNVLALAAVAQTVPDNKYFLIITGLATSIPMVIFGAHLLVKVMDRFPVIVYLGAGILGYAAAEMLLTDRSIAPYLAAYHLAVQVILPLAVVGIGYWRRQATAKPSAQTN